MQPASISMAPLLSLLKIFFFSDADVSCSDEQAKSQTNGAQKKLNQSIRRDPRRYRSTKRGKELHWRANPPKRTPRHSERNGTASDSKFPPEQYSTQRSFNMQAPSRSFSGLSISSQKAFSLLKNLTIKTEPEGPMSRQGTVIQPACNIPLYAGGRLPCPLPGDFLTLDSHLEDTLYIDYNPEKQHQYVSFDMIWADIRVERNLWVINRGLSGKAIAALSHLQKVPTAIKLDDTDAFGNTLMHFLAARHDSQEQLISLLGSPAMTDSYLLRQNTGGQSFLHVLAREWFSNPKEKSCPFWTLLGQIDQVFTTLAPLRDVYGRNFFHHVKLCLEDNATASDMIHAVIAVKKLDPSILCQRDAFGTDIVGPQAQPEEAMVSGMIVPSDGQSLPYRDYQLVTEDTYQHIFERAKVDKNIEDGYGRGALHALAITASKLQPNRKRKASEPLYSSRDIAPGIQQQQYQKVASPITTLETAIAPVSPTTIGEESTGEFAKKAQELINEGCSVSHYDRKGHTALMAFIELLPEDKSIELLLSTLVDAAVREGMLDARNRDGETALMVAARLGKISAVQALVSAGANQHTRHARHRHVRGLLQTIHHEMGKHKNDPRVVGPLDACLKVLAVPDKDVSSADAEPPKAVLFPDAIDEWGIELAIPSCHVVSNSV